jgi:hypothetical protein
MPSRKPLKDLDPQVLTIAREPIPELIQVVLLILRELRQRLPVHTSRSLVGLDLLVCVPHQSLRDIERLAC